MYRPDMHSISQPFSNALDVLASAQSVLLKVLLVAVGVLVVLVAIRVKGIMTSSLRDLPGPKAKSFYSGHLNEIFGSDVVPWHLAMVQKYGRLFKVKGLLGADQLYVTDPLALHYIVVKEQDVWEESPKFIYANRLAFGHSLLGALGDEHRKQRKMLNPSFSVAHLKGLLPVFYSGAYRCRDALNKYIDTVGSQVDIRQWSSRLTLDGIGEGGFGYSFNTFDDKVNDTESSRYRTYIKGTSEMIRNSPIIRYFLPYLMTIGTPKMWRSLVDLIPFGKVYQARQIVDGLHSMATMVYKMRKSELGTEAEGKDVMSVLLRANEKIEAKDRLQEPELIAQITMLIFAGVHTTSSGLSQVLNTLSLRPDVQSKLREEILAMRKECSGEEPTHEQLITMPYLDAVVRETLRLYAPVIMVTRTAVKDTILPLSTPIISKSGQIISSIHVKRGTEAVIGIRAVNQDPLIWGPDAKEWKPERWLGKRFPEVSHEKLPGIYSGMMTFLGGSRACIGFKFSELETKASLFAMVESFQFSPAVKVEDVERDITRGKDARMNVTRIA